MQLEYTIEHLSRPESDRRIHSPRLIQELISLLNFPEISRNALRHVTTLLQQLNACIILKNLLYSLIFEFFKKFILNALE